MRLPFLNPLILYSTWPPDVLHKQRLDLLYCFVLVFFPDQNAQDDARSYKSRVLGFNLKRRKDRLARRIRSWPRLSIRELAWKVWRRLTTRLEPETIIGRSALFTISSAEFPSSNPPSSVAFSLLKWPVSSLSTFPKGCWERARIHYWLRRDLGFYEKWRSVFTAPELSAWLDRAETFPCRSKTCAGLKQILSHGVFFPPK